MLILTVACGATICYGGLGDLILAWSFLSMGLRGAVVAFPMLFAIYAPGKVKRKYTATAMVLGVAFTITGRAVLPLDFDPLYLGLLASFLCMFIGFNKKKGSMLWRKNEE